MGFLISAKKVVLQSLAEAMAPPPPPDITRWCEENIVFDERSPMPGPFQINKFPFLREIHECLSPEHPSREVTFIKSAQVGGTVSLINPTLGAFHEYGPVDSLVVHPTTSAATEWVDNKWLPMRRTAPSLIRMFGNGKNGDHKDAKFNQETLRRDGSLKVCSAGSPDDLAGTTRRLVMMDDVSKFDMTPKGDPEALAVSRASAFEDAKIVRISTPQIKGTCRVTRSYDRSDKRVFHVPCPHCGHFAPLTWENFKKNIDPNNLGAACFHCEECGCVISHEHKEKMVQNGKWVATNPLGDHPGFYIWRAYAPQRDWASIAHDYARCMGWSNSRDQDVKESVDAETEQTFFNDVLGLPYEQASKGPDWELLQERGEGSPEHIKRPVGRVPAKGVLLTAGVDCQLDRTEVHIVAWGQNYQRWVVEYIVIPHHIDDEEGRSALNALLKRKWATELGYKLPLDMMAIDGGAYTEAVWSFAKCHPWQKVIVVKGAKSSSGPALLPMKFERRKDGKAKRSQKRGFMLNVSQMKADFYAWLEKTDINERGYCDFPRGLNDEYYRMISSEVRVLKRSPSGAMTSSWQLVEPTRRNEALDTMNYAEAAARRIGWASYTPEQWDALTAIRSVEAETDQGDLFEKTLIPADAQPQPASQEQVYEPKPQPKKTRNSYLGDRTKSWRRK